MSSLKFFLREDLIWNKKYADDSIFDIQNSYMYINYKGHGRKNTVLVLQMKVSTFRIFNKVKESWKKPKWHRYFMRDIIKAFGLISFQIIFQKCVLNFVSSNKNMYIFTKSFFHKYLTYIRTYIYEWRNYWKYLLWTQKINQLTLNLDKIIQTKIS